MLDRVLISGARWFLRRRLNRMIEEVNVRLELQIPAFQQTRRRVLIDRLNVFRKTDGFPDAVRPDGKSCRLRPRPSLSGS